MKCRHIRHHCTQMKNEFLLEKGYFKTFALSDKCALSQVRKKLDLPQRLGSRGPCVRNPDVKRQFNTFTRPETPQN